MKQLFVMVVATLWGVGGSALVGPHVGVIIYYLYAVLRPQFIWQGPLSEYGGESVAWSFYVALAAIGCTIFSGAGRPAMRITAAHFAVWALAAQITFSLAMARHVDFALPYFIEYAKLFVMFTVGSFALRERRHLWTLLIVVALADAYVASEINQHYFLSGWLFLASRGFGGLDNNGAALMFAMAIPACYFLWESTLHPARWGYLLGAAFLGHAVMLSFSRGAMLSLLVTSPLLFFFSQRRGRSIVLLALAGAGALAVAGPEVQNRFLSINEHDADESANSRKTTWAIAIRMANEAPLHGFGVRCSTLYTKSYGADIDGRAIHSTYLQLAADCGWPATTFFVGMLGGSAWAAFRAWRGVAGRTDPEAVRTRAIAGSTTCGLAIYAVGSAFLSLDTFELPYILVLIVAQLHGLGPPPLPGGGAAPAPGRRFPAGWPTPWTPLRAPIGGRRRPAPKEPT